MRLDAIQFALQTDYIPLTRITYQAFGLDATKKITADKVDCIFWLREPDLNRRPPGYEPDELPGCSIPRYMRCSATLNHYTTYIMFLQVFFIQYFYLTNSFENIVVTRKIINSTITTLEPGDVSKNNDNIRPPINPARDTATAVPITDL